MGDHDIWLPRNFEEALFHFTKIDASEEFMVPDLYPTLRPLFRVLLQEPADEILALITHCQRELNFLMNNTIHDLILIV